MVQNVLCVVDGSAPPGDVASLADSLLPRAAEVVVLQVVPQLPYAWTAWPTFPDAAEDLARAWAYVSEISRGLKACEWAVSTRVHFSPMSAAELDREILKFSQMLRPDLIFLALERGRVRARVVREAAMPVLVATLSSPDEEAGGRKARAEYAEPAVVHRRLLLNPAGAFVFRLAGIL
ncbi:MAG TPA: hypothetical protein VLM91_28365 [Candidatus Methylomirabilis sp.]|nr:hypothetical protein [Candidatus Methylomirabilis sp.]